LSSWHCKEKRTVGFLFGLLVEKLNNAFITLIPKKAGAAQVKDFRPISLVHSFAKLVTKVLANRLAGKLNDMYLQYKVHL
jgi:hypothetical protein